MIEADRMRLFTCVGAGEDTAILPYFLEHYLGLGIPASNIHVILNAGHAAEPGLELVRRHLRNRDIEPGDLWIGPYTSSEMWARRREAQRKFASPRDWVISADVDEFHEYPRPLADFLAHCERRSVNAVQGVFIDRLAPGGELRSIDPGPSLWDQFPVQAEVACSIGGTGDHHGWLGTVKLMAFSSDLEPSLGGHTVDEQYRSTARFWFDRDLGDQPFIQHAWFRGMFPLRVHHFKWRAGLIEHLRERLATPGASPGGSEYGRKILGYCERDRRIRLRDVPVYRREALWSAVRQPQLSRAVGLAGSHAGALKRWGFDGVRRILSKRGR